MLTVEGGGCALACTSPPRVNSGVVLVVEVWLVQVTEGLHLDLCTLEQVELAQQGQPHKPQLEDMNINGNDFILVTVDGHFSYYIEQQK